jgi:hypothetical protein
MDQITYQEAVIFPWEDHEKDESQEEEGEEGHQARR